MAFPFSSRLIRSNSRLPSSMVMRRRLSGTMEQPAHNCGFAGTGAAGNADRYSIPDTAGQKVQHFPGGGTGTNQFLPGDRLLVHNPNGSVDPDFRINNRCLVHRDTDILSRNPITDGMVSSITIPQVLRRRRITSMACCGLKTCPGFLRIGRRS